MEAVQSTASGALPGPQTGQVAQELRRLFLDMSRDDMRRARASELVQFSSDVDAAQCIPLVMDRLVNIPSAYGLGIYVLHELLQLHPVVVAQHIESSAVYDLFNARADDAEAASFLHVLLCFKESQGLPTGPECAKLQKLLMRRAKVQDLRKVPASPLRAWLSRIWCECPSSRPEASLVSECVVRWVADKQVASFAKLPCLAIARHEFDVRGRPDADAWLAGLILEQVCRDPVGHSPDLQHLLWSLRGQPLDQTALKPLLSDMAKEQGRLVTLWVCLALWAPQEPPDDAPPWPDLSPPPVHCFLLTLLTVFSELTDATQLCRTCLLMLVMISASGGSSNTVAVGAAEMLSVAHRLGPQLGNEVWRPVAVALQATSPGPSPALPRLLAALERTVVDVDGPRIQKGSEQFHNGLSHNDGFFDARHASESSIVAPYDHHGSREYYSEPHRIQGACYGGGHLGADCNGGPIETNFDKVNQTANGFCAGLAEADRNFGAQNAVGGPCVHEQMMGAAGPPTYPDMPMAAQGNAGMPNPEFSMGPGASMAAGGRFAADAGPQGCYATVSGAPMHESMLPGFAMDPGLQHGFSTVPGPQGFAMDPGLQHGFSTVPGPPGMTMDPRTQNGFPTAPGSQMNAGGPMNPGCMMDFGAQAGFTTGPGASMMSGPPFGQPGMDPSAPNGFMPSMGQGPPNTNGGCAPLAPSSGDFLPPLVDGIPVNYEPVHVGIQNTNNTCYMNSFIQGLFLTSGFLARIFAFQLFLKNNPSQMDREDYEFGTKLVDVLQKHLARMQVTRLEHIDLWAVLQVFPDIYRKGEQQDVTETIRFVFDKLGSFDQPLIREVFAGELSEMLQCQACMNVREKPETFTDLVLPVPTEAQVRGKGVFPTIQGLINERLKYELLDADMLLECERCQQKQRHAKWSEIVSPPQHLCLCLNRFAFDPNTMDLEKEKTPIYINPQLQIGPFTYDLYHVIVHTGKTATSGHYYAVGKRSECKHGNNEWFKMDDSQVKPPDLSMLSGNVPQSLKDDNPYVLFYHCQQAPPAPQLRVPQHLAELAWQEDAKQT